MTIVMGIGGCPFLPSGRPSRRKGRSAGQELRPDQEAEAPREFDRHGRRKGMLAQWAPFRLEALTHRHAAHANEGRWAALKEVALPPLCAELGMLSSESIENRT
jgi:hypothetical protein